MLIDYYARSEGADVKCSSSDPSVDSKIYLMLPYIERFVAETSTCKSVDCYLIKLDSLIYRIEDYFGRERALIVFDKMLKCEEIRESLRPLAGYASEAERLVLSDPRHKLTRKYRDLILTTLKELEPMEKPLGVIRPPLIRIERGEETVEPRRFKPPITPHIQEPTHISGRGTMRKKLIVIIAFLILAAVLVSLALLFRPLY
jgi:hypothetical protein